MSTAIQFEIPGFMVGVFPSNADLSASGFVAVDLVAAGSGISAYAGGGIDLPVSNGYPVLGILQNGPVANEAATIMINGVSKAIAGTGGWTVRQQLAAKTDGSLIAATTGMYIVATALCAADAGQVGAVLLRANGIAA